MESLLGEVAARLNGRLDTRVLSVVRWGSTWARVSNLRGGRWASHRWVRFNLRLGLLDFRVTMASPTLLKKEKDIFGI